MKAKVYPVTKRDVSKLNDASLEELAAFRHTEAFKILARLAEDAKVARAMDALQSDNPSEQFIYRGLNLGVDFIMDAAHRAAEILKEKDENAKAS